MKNRHDHANGSGRFSFSYTDVLFRHRAEVEGTYLNRDLSDELLGIQIAAGDSLICLLALDRLSCSWHAPRQFRHKRLAPAPCLLRSRSSGLRPATCTFP